MFVEFSISNYLSIKEEQTLSFSATKLKEHVEHLIHPSGDGKKINLLRSAIIYGANASGKSNIIKAINDLFNIILFSHKLDINQPIPSYRPYKLDELWLKKPSMFEVEFIPKDKLTYRYLIEFNNCEIIREELFFSPKGQEALLFSRKKGEKIKFGNYLTGRKKSIESELLNNQLFLTKAAYSKQPQLYDIYLFFLENRDFIERSEDSDIFSSHKTSKAICNKHGKDYQKKVEIFLSSVDTGVKSIHVDLVEKDIEDKFTFPDLPDWYLDKLKDEITLQVKTTHDLYKGGKKIGKTFLDLRDESFGTKKLYSLISHIIDALDNGTLLCIDEIDNSLHPIITSFIVNLFNNPKTNKKNAQLIAATHDSSLLNPKFIRRDQIWFTHKLNNGSTQLYSLAEFDKNEVRAGTPFANWYLTGRFDAIPVIDKRVFELFENTCKN